MTTGAGRRLLGVGLVVFIAATVVHLAAQAGETTTAQDWSQGFLMPALALVVWAWYPPGLVRTGVLAALLFSWVGDMLPKFVPEDAEFLAMVGGFLVAQVIYVVVFSRWVRIAVRTPRGQRPLVIATLVYLPVVIVLSILMLPHAGSLTPAVAAYAVIIALMAVCSWAVHPIAGVGAALFVISDALIGLNTFWPAYDLPGHGLWVMLTYIAAQAVLVLGIGRRLVIDRADQSD